MTDQAENPENASEGEDLETVPVMAVKRRGGDMEIATRGHGWPSEIPTEDGHESWMNAMDAIKYAVDLTDADRGEQVGEMTVDPDTREVTNWNLKEDYRVGEDGDRDD